MSSPKLIYPDVLRILAIIGVVLIHVTAPTVGESVRIPHAAFWWISNMFNSAARWSVPVFVMVSGMLILGTDKTLNLREHYKLRMMRVIPAFLIWSIVYYVWGKRHALHTVDSIDFLKGLVQDSIHYHLWFVYMLIGLYIIAPPLRVFVKHASTKMLVYICVACFIAHNASAILGLMNIQLGIQVPKWTGYIGYFLLGYLLSRHSFHTKARVVLYIGGIAAYAATVVGNYALLFHLPDRAGSSYFYNYLSLPVLFMSVALFVWVKQLKFETMSTGIVNGIHFLSASTYSIYLSHVLFFEFFYEKRPWDIINGNPLYYVPIVTGIVLISSLLLYVLQTMLLRIRTIRINKNSFPQSFQAISDQFKEIYSYREMLYNLVMKDLRAKYKGSVLGFFWTFLNPILMLAIYSFVFSFLIKMQIPNYPLFILVALLPWNYFTQAVTQGAGILLQNADVLKKIYFPREVLPISAVISSLANYILTLAVLIPVLWFFGFLHVTLISFPLILLVQTLLVLFIVMLVSVGSVYFRDLAHFIAVFLTVFFYLTPIIFPLELIPETFRWLFELNPFTVLIDAYRNIFLSGLWPDFVSLLKMALFLIVINGIAFRMFAYLQRNVAEEI